MHRFATVLLLLGPIVMTGCTFDPGEPLSAPVDVRVNRASVADESCSSAASHDACHVLEVTVESRSESNVSLAPHAWEASQARHYAARDDPVWMRPVAVEGAPSVAANDTTDVVLRFDADPEVRLGILRFHHEGPGSNVTGFVPAYKSSPDANATYLGSAVNVGGPGST